MGRSDVVIRRCWKNGWTVADFSVMMVAVDLGSSADQEDRLIVRSTVIVINHQTYDPHTSVHPEHSQTADRAKFMLRRFRFHLCPDDYRRQVWRQPGQCADLAFTIARHTGPQQGVMVWGVISFEAGPFSLSLEAHLQHIGTSTAFRELFCYRFFCSTLVLFVSKIPHTTRVALNCLTAYQTFPWLARSPDTFPIEHA
ncbi:transposable element Tc1 transposase [Trichonephila clavipes]|nr:transposable element Tc1 transposase [Trichonephila clavipes]